MADCCQRAQAVLKHGRKTGSACEVPIKPLPVVRDALLNQREPRARAVWEGPRDVLNTSTVVSTVYCSCLSEGSDWARGKEKQKIQMRLKTLKCPELLIWAECSLETSYPEHLTKASVPVREKEKVHLKL